jgi:rubrerythrin
VKGGLPRRAALATSPGDQLAKEFMKMSQSNLFMPGGLDTARRGFLGGLGKATLSATTVAILVGCESMARGTTVAQESNPAQDVAILNVALGLEHEAIDAYQLGAESGLLQKQVVEVAVLFQSHHKEHRDALVATVQKLGGQPAEAKPIGDTAKALGADTLASQSDVLKLAARLERGAANAYLGVIPAFADPMLAQVSGRLAADETMHWALLANVLGEPVPQMALSFGA